MHHHGAKGFFRIISLVVAGVGFACLFALGFGWLIKWLWNWLMPSLFGLKAITYWQAFGLIVLLRLLFGSFHHGNHHRFLHNRFQNWHRDNDYEWAPGGDHRNWRFYKSYWTERGKQDFEAYLRSQGKTEEMHCG